MHQSIRSMVVAIAGACLLAACANAPRQTSKEQRVRQVADTERAFAKTMADRDFAAFTSFLSEETIFFSGAQPLRGKQAVSAAWQKFFQQPRAPFSWAPDRVEVLDSGGLALSTGPVHDANGKLIGRFTSIWRLEAPDTWRIIFDQGCEVCDCAKS
jgi:ketosteroid isomerase-like protein